MLTKELAGDLSSSSGTFRGNAAGLSDVVILGTEAGVGASTTCS
jgi:hypothetical protein